MAGYEIIALLVLLAALIFLFAPVENVIAVNMAYNTTNPNHWTATLTTTQLTPYEYVFSNRGNVITSPIPAGSYVVNMSIFNSGHKIWTGNYALQSGNSYTLFTHQLSISNETLYVNINQTNSHWVFSLG